jgi:trimethylamine--corrinoid protein Co-methyltransferase
MAGPGHFLGHEQTLQLMQTEYLYPAVADRSSPKEWAERGSDDLLDRARARMRAILAEHYPVYIDPAVDRTIRARFPIRQPRSAPARPEIFARNRVFIVAAPTYNHPEESGAA